MPFLPPETKKKITQIFESRLAMKPIKIVKAFQDKLQNPVKPWQILELQKNGSHYYFIPTTNDKFPMPIATGLFIFVILANDPGRVFCGMPLWPDKDEYRRYEYKDDARAPFLFVHGGHTSLSLRTDVLYAGAIELRHSELMQWTNESGHYAPSGMQRHSNLLPAVKLLLPEDKFFDYSHQTQKHLEDRGYGNDADISAFHAARKLNS